MDGASDGEVENELTASLYAATWIATALAVYNCMEVYFLVYSSFTRFRGLYFWALTWCNTGIVIFAVGQQHLNFKWYESNAGMSRALGFTLFGWISTVTGFAVVLYSRLSKLGIAPSWIHTTRNVICFNFCAMHLPITFLRAGLELVEDPARWIRAYNAWEAVQLLSFSFQEVLLAGLYLVKLGELRGASLSMQHSSILKQGIFINCTVVVLDLVVLGLEFLGLHSYQSLVKILLYSSKLKLEFYILSRLATAVNTNILNLGKQQSGSRPSTTVKQSLFQTKLPSRKSRQVREDEGGA